ncbi:putative serine-rich protein [Neolecta irregularis DAH-3]|uniref:Putative serine-rich protein n=1 Tax=Neolecta irregularis (strain DAH-3) TaxID=1198029 RepID=A0A1U7LLS2_NEOID|nr:putative serine-rich protein [Neolecta irregularis DAH-3]|eukprot:OLL23461.1 putative serine-rich protein [Neolecta irregularis DAH-3]
MFSMRSFGIFVASTAVLAQSLNPISVPSSGQIVTAGSAFQIKWAPDNASTITLGLRQGPANNLLNVSIIASDIPNLGLFNWLIPSTMPPANNYAIQISEGTTGANSNYSPFFGITGGSTSNRTATTNTTTPKTTSSANFTLPTGKTAIATGNVGTSLQATSTLAAPTPSTTKKSEACTFGASLALALLGSLVMA